jgi:nucleoside-diphosphate-sugar epimerase
MSSSTIIAGAGDVGGRVANALCNAAHDVIAISRHAREQSGAIRTMVADLSSGEGFTKLPHSAEALVFCVAPDERTPEAYHRLYVEGLQRLLDHCQFQRVIFVSSTAVYAQDAGEWVDEQTPALADTFNGQILREAELLCGQQQCGTALRFTGIYGPGRNWMLRRAQAGEVGRAHWTNRIHVEDVASAIVHVRQLATPSDIYCGNDNCPALESEVLAWLRSPDVRIKPAFDDDPLATGRRVRNQRLRASGWQPKYANYREGYRQLFNTTGV